MTISERILLRLKRWIDRAERIHRERVNARHIKNGELIIGDHSYGQPEIAYDKYSDTNIQIGKFCSIAVNVKIFNGSNHNVDWVTTYPIRIMLNLKGKYEDGHPQTKGNVIIGNDVWIGQGATIYSGVTIGDGAVIAGNSVVVADVPPYTIVGGSPAKLIKERFNKNQIDALLEIKWWDWSLEKIKMNAEHLCDSEIDKFIQNNAKLEH